MIQNILCQAGPLTIQADMIVLEIINIDQDIMIICLNMN